MSPVELLREAAKVMRERARAATPGPWVVADRGAAYGGSEEIANLVSEAGRAVANAGGGGRAFLLADADHAASWHPAVALAVADWLDGAASDPEFDPECCGEGDACFACETAKSALAVARAYLGGES